MEIVVKEDRVLDCSGLLCPMPIVNTAKAMKELQKGQVLKVIATDAGFPPDAEAWSRQTGNELLHSIVEDGRFIVFLKKN